MLAAYRKTVAAVLGAGGTWCVAALPHGVTEMEWVALGIAVATALGVYSVANEPQPVVVQNEPVAVTKRTRRKDAGHSDLIAALVVLLIVVIVLAAVGLI